LRSSAPFRRPTILPADHSRSLSEISLNRKTSVTFAVVIVWPRRVHRCCWRRNCTVTRTFSRSPHDALRILETRELADLPKVGRPATILNSRRARNHPEGAYLRQVGKGNRPSLPPPSAKYAFSSPSLRFGTQNTEIDSLSILCPATEGSRNMPKQPKE